MSWRWPLFHCQVRCHTAAQRRYTHPMACTYDNAMLRRARASLMTWLCFYSYTMPTQMTYQGITLVRASISTSDVTSTCLYSSHISSIEHCLNSTSRRIMSIYTRGCSVFLGCIPVCLQIDPMELTIAPGAPYPPDRPAAGPADRPRYAALKGRCHYALCEDATCMRPTMHTCVCP